MVACSSELCHDYKSLALELILTIYIYIYIYATPVGVHRNYLYWAG